MSVVSDKLKKAIDKVLNTPTEKIKSQIDVIVKNTRQGKDEGDKIKNVLDKIEMIESGVETIKSSIKSLKSVQKSLKAAKTAGDAARKAALISSALNPPAAAAAVAQEIIIDKVKQEVEDAKNALNVAPTLVQNFQKTIIELKEKLRKVKNEKERKDALREQRKNNINS